MLSLSAAGFFVYHVNSHGLFPTPDTVFTWVSPFSNIPLILGLCGQMILGSVMMRYSSRIR